MTIIERFGQRVSDLSADRPAAARRLLTTGFRANGVKNAVAHKGVSRSDQMLFQLVNDAMIGCLARPEQDVMVSLFTPCELLLCQGLRPYSCEGMSSYLSGSMAEQGFLHRAEDEGFSPTLCSYHKTFLGAAQTGVLPRPRFILSTTLYCDGNMRTFPYLAEWYDVPHFVLDVPYDTDEAAVQYVAGELRRMAEFVTAQTGVPVDEARLRETVGRSARTLRDLDAAMTARRGRYLPSDLTSELMRTAALHFLLGSQGAMDYAAQYRREAESAPPARGQQLLWIHTTPYWVPPLRALFNRTERVQIAACDMSYEGIVEMDPDKPYEAMARRLVLSSFNGPTQRRIDRALEVARQVGATGAVWSCHWGCKHTLGGARLGKDAFEAAGLPTLLLDCDCCDRSYGGAGQAATRMEAFLEMLEGRER